MKGALKAIAVLAVTLLFGAVATAQTPTTNTITTQSIPVEPPGQTPRPPPPLSADSVKSIGHPHACGGVWYPPKALRLGLEGTVVLSFTVTAQGTVTDAKIVSSSGSDDLDQATVACAAQWQYKPAMKNGQPIAAPWTAKVNWSLSGSDPAPVSSQGCPASLLPADGSLASSGRAASLFFHIRPDGTVRDVAVSRSSGSDGLDQLAIKCVSQWRYAPNGNSTRDILWESTVAISPDAGSAITAVTDIAAPKEFGTRDACRKPATISDTPSADTVVLADILPFGDVTNVRLLQSSGSSKLDDFALSCVPSLKFTRAIHHGLVVSVTIPVRIVW
jgi:TonB family protein